MITIDYIMGDSIAAGIAINGFGLKNRSGAYAVKSKDAKGISEVGASPKKILGFLEEIGKQNFTNKNVILSTGLSNGPTDLDNIRKELQLLKDVNAKVYMIGVSNKPPSNLPDLKGGNDKLKTLASEFGFTFFGGFDPISDGVHPNYSNYYKNTIKPVLEKPETVVVKPDLGISTSTVDGKSGSSGSIYGLSGASPSATPSIPPEPPIKGVFVFNTEKPGILSSTALGELRITEKELAAEDAFIFGDEGNYEQQLLDEEYSELAYTGSEEDIAFDIAEGQKLSQGQELLTSLNTDSPTVAVNTQGDNGNPNEVQTATINTVAKGKIKKMLEIAKGEVGYTEKSTSKYPGTPGKDTKYGVYWGLNGHHYCGMFVCWCAEHAGMKVTNRDSKPYKGAMSNSIACPTGVNIFKDRNAFVSNGSSKAARSSSTVKPEPGDIVFFSWDYNQKADHVGIVVEDLGNGTVKCLEGNTSPGKGGANQKGSGVWERSRSKATILGYGKTAIFDPTNLDEFTGPAGKAAKSA